MNWITEHIAVGNHLDAQNTEVRKREGIAS